METKIKKLKTFSKKVSAFSAHAFSGVIPSKFTIFDKIIREGYARGNYKI